MNRNWIVCSSGEAIEYNDCRMIISCGSLILHRGEDDSIWPEHLVTAFGPGAWQTIEPNGAA